MEARDREKEKQKKLKAQRKREKEARGIVDDSDSEEIDVAPLQEQQIVPKNLAETLTEHEKRLDESRPPTRPVSATLSERNAKVDPSAVADALQGAGGGRQKLKREPGEELEPPMDQAADLAGPQRFLVTIDMLEELQVSEGHIFLRLSMGNLVRESKRYKCEDQLEQGIVKVWTGRVKINEEFYWEIGDNDAFVSCLLMHVKEKGGDPVDLGEVKLEAKKFKAKATSET